MLVLSSLWFALCRFLEDALSFAEWAANVYAGTLAYAVWILDRLPLFSTPRASCHRPGIPARDR